MRLTDIQLEAIENTLTETRLGADAAAEIRELRAENAKLREYVGHKPGCMKSRRDPCNCGLDAALGKDD